ncbi:MAG: hypothetical protein QM765_46405 [Myxococcales bacterium]
MFCSPPPPQTFGAAQVPHSSRPPQPSSMLPHWAPAALQVAVTTQEPASGTLVTGGLLQATRASASVEASTGRCVMGILLGVPAEPADVPQSAAFWEWPAAAPPHGAAARAGGGVADALRS